MIAPAGDKRRKAPPQSRSARAPRGAPRRGYLDLPPRQAGYEAVEREFEDEREHEPCEADNRRLAAGFDRPDPDDNPDVHCEERNQQKRGELARMQLANLGSQNGLAECAVPDRDKNHRKPGKQIAPHGHVSATPVSATPVPAR